MTVVGVAGAGRRGPSLFNVMPRAAAMLPDFAPALERVTQAIDDESITGRDIDRIVGTLSTRWHKVELIGHALPRLCAIASVLAIVQAGRNPSSVANWFATAHPRLRGFTPRGLLVARQEALWILLDVLRRESEIK